MSKRELTHAEWKKEAVALFGADPLKWRFVCPLCGHVASVQDYRDAGAEEGLVAFSCIGRALGSDKHLGDKSGGPCNYAGAELFRLNPVTVVFEDGTKSEFFEFDKAEVSA